MRSLKLLALLLAAGATIGSGRLALAQQQDLPPLTPQRHYNGLVAGEEAYIANSGRRLANMQQQFNLNADMYWRWSGVSSWYPGVFEAWPMVPGNVWGWPAAAVPPRVTSTAIAPPTLVAAQVHPAQGRPVAPRPARPKPVDHPPAAGSGLLPGFVPQTDPADQPAHPTGPRAF